MGFIDKRRKYWRRRHAILGYFTLAFLAGAVLYATIGPLFVRKPLMDPRGEIPSSLPVETTERLGRKWTGVASWYSREHCLGCSENLHMANGQPLDDNALTVAFNKLPLGRRVRVTNATSMMTVVATVTDTGGFERLGRIIDITPAVKTATICGGLCEVVVEEILE